MKLSQLKSLIIQSSMYLGLRHVLGMALSIIGILLILRQLGPSSYGLVAVSTAILGYLSNFGALGLNVYLVRRPGELAAGVVQQVFLMITGLGALVGLAVLWAAPWVAPWVGEPKIIDLLRFMVIGFWVRQASLTSLALMERDLCFRAISLIELGGPLVYYAVAVPLVFSGWDYWGVAIGGLVQSVFMAALTFWYRPINWQWIWDRKLIGEAFAYGISYQISAWIWQLRDLAVPLLISRFVGLDAVGILNAAKQFAERLTFPRLIFWRISVSAFAKIQDDPRAVREGISQGMQYQLLLMGPLLALFSSVSTWLMPTLLGSQWQLIAKFFPFIACALLINGIFSLHCSALYAKGYNNAVSQFHIAHVGTLWLASLALIPWLGMWGYGVAELVALWSYWVIHQKFTVFYERPSYGRIKVLLLASVIPLLLGPWLPLMTSFMVWLACGVVVLVFDLHLRTTLAGFANSIKVRFGRSPQP